MERLKKYLEKKDCYIEKKINEIEEKTMIVYEIKNKEIDEGNEGLLQIWICLNDEEYISKLNKKQEKKFNELKEKTSKEIYYCYISWINGSKKYKNMGKLIMLYMMLDISQDERLFIIKLDNSSNSRDTYKKFGFVAYNNDEEEIMCSLSLKKIISNISGIFK